MTLEIFHCGGYVPVSKLFSFEHRCWTSRTQPPGLAERRRCCCGAQTHGAPPRRRGACCRPAAWRARTLTCACSLTDCHSWRSRPVTTRHFHNIHRQIIVLFACLHCVNCEKQKLWSLTFLLSCAGTRVVLGLPASGRAGWSPTSPVPAEQAVSWHTLRPGSGRLDVTLCADGPTRVVRIHDHKDPV